MERAPPRAGGVLPRAARGLRRSCSRSRPTGTKHCWHLFVVLVEDRDAFRGRLRERGVETLVHYPEPIHKQAAYAHLPRVEVPVSERLCEQVVSLPLYPELTDAEAEQVVQAVLAG